MLNYSEALNFKAAKSFIKKLKKKKLLQWKKAVIDHFNQLNQLNNLK